MSITSSTIPASYAAYTRMSPGLPISTTIADAKRLEAFAKLVGKANMLVYDDSYAPDDIKIRPALQYLLEDVRDGKFDAVVVADIKALCRSLEDFEELYEFLQLNNINLIVLGHDDLRSPYTLFEIRASIVQDDFERRGGNEQNTDSAILEEYALQMMYITDAYQKELARIRKMADKCAVMFAGFTKALYEDELEDPRDVCERCIEQTAA
jgi:hypothetical protein